MGGMVRDFHKGAWAKENTTQASFPPYKLCGLVNGKEVSRFPIDYFT